MESKSSIPRRVRPDDTTDTSSKKPDDQQTSLISTLAPPPVISEPPKKLKHTPPRNKSPVPTSSSTQSPSLRQPVNTMEHSTKTFIPPTKSANLSQGENRTISNLDKYIDVVASAIKKKKERSSANSVLDRINVGESRREGSKRGGGVDLFGSFQSTSDRLDFFNSDPQTSAPIISPLPNTRLPIFPEDFPPNGPNEWPLSWWGIVEPSQELLAMHEKVAEELGYPIGKRKRGGDSTPNSDKKEEEKKVKESGAGSKEQSRRDGERSRSHQSQRDGEKSRSSRHRHSRERDERRSHERRSDGSSRRSSERRSR